MSLSDRLIPKFLPWSAAKGFEKGEGDVEDHIAPDHGMRCPERKVPESRWNEDSNYLEQNGELEGQHDNGIYDKTTVPILDT